MMHKYYRDSETGEVFAYEADGSQDQYIKPGLVRMTDAEVDAHLSQPPTLPVVPQSVTMRQARLAMLQAGILDKVEELIAAMPGDEGRAARIDWEYALEVRRDWPLIAALGSQLGLSEQQIDDLFMAAASIPQ